MPLNQKPIFGLARPKIDLVVDVSNLAYRAAHRFKELSHQGNPTGHIFGTLSMLSSLKRHYSEKYDPRLVFALDGYCKWRRDILPDYKGNRGVRGTQDHEMMNDVVGLIRLLPGLTILAPDDEADDVIATHVSTYSTKQHVVFSMDRDLWQLCSSHMVRVIITSKDPPVSVYDIDGHFHTTNPRLVPLSKALIGDKSDNISGVKGFSRQDMKLILDQMTNPSVDEFLAVTKKLDVAGKMKPRTMTVAQDNIKQITETLTVTTLKRDCKYQEQQNVPNEPELRKRLIDLACNSLIDKLPVFYGAQIR